jgi:hypothetical protein
MDLQGLSERHAVITDEYLRTARRSRITLGEADLKRTNETVASVTILNFKRVCEMLNELAENGLRNEDDPVVLERSENGTITASVTPVNEAKEMIDIDSATGFVVVAEFIPAIDDGPYDKLEQYFDGQHDPEIAERTVDMLENAIGNRELNPQYHPFPLDLDADMGLYRV